MPWCPFAVDKRLPEWKQEPPITPTTLIFHSIVGTLEGADAHFRFGTTIEAHFGVGKGRSGPPPTPDPDGEIWQWQTTSRQADANYKANPFAVSVETEDNGNPNTDPWNPPQLRRLVRLGLWVLDKHPTIPRRRAKTWDGGGIGYHVMFGAPGAWTPVSKSCPGAVRIEQFNDVLLPALLAGDPLPEDEDMPITEGTRGDGRTIAIQALSNDALRARHARIKAEGGDPQGAMLVMDDWCGEQTLKRVWFQLDEEYPPTVSQRKAGTIPAETAGLLAAIVDLEYRRIDRLRAGDAA